MIYKTYIIEENINLINKKFFLFFGENIGLKIELKKKIKEHNKESDFINLDQNEILKNENLLLEEIYNRSLFGRTKIYFIEQVNDKILDIVKELKNKIGEQKIYLFSEILDKKSKIRNYFEKSEHTGAAPCYPDTDITIKKILQKKLKGFEGLTPENLNLISENCNLDRTKLNNELNKIVIYFKNNKIENKELEILLNIKTNDDFNLLKNEALVGNKYKTNKLLSDTVLDIEKNIFYLSLINSRLNKLAEVINLSKNTNLEKAITMLKPPLFWKDKPIFTAQVEKWSLKNIRKILEKTYKLEIEIKSGSFVNKNLLVKKLILDICSVASS